MESHVGKNIWYVSASTITSSILTFTFWLLVAKIAGPSAIGTASYINSVAIIVSSIVLLDVQLGMKRQLGFESSRSNFPEFRTIILASVCIIGIALVTTLVVLFSIASFLSDSLEIKGQYYYVFVSMIVVISFQLFLSEVLISGLRSRILIFSVVISSILRFPLFLVLIHTLNDPVEASVYSFISAYIVNVCICAAYILPFLVNGKLSIRGNKVWPRIKRILSTSMSSWTPHVIYVLGNQLALVSVVAIGGFSEAGTFYITMSVYLVTMFVVTGITKVTHSVISNVDHRSQNDIFSSYVRLAFFTTMPLAAGMAIYSDQFLSLMGPSFEHAAASLSILMLGIPLAIVCEITYYFAYGLGDHSVVLKLGFAGNIPRIGLYLVLPSFLGIDGASVAYVIGLVSQFAFSLTVIRKYHFCLSYRSLTIFSSMPFVFGMFFYALDLNFFVGLVLIYLTSILVFVRMRMFMDVDLYNILFAIFSSRIANLLNYYLSRIIKFIQR